MKLKNEIILAYCVIAIFFVIGVICYALPEKGSKEPIRIMLKASAGKVLFDHKGHYWEEGYGLDCIDCHHAWDEDIDTSPMSCTECHEIDSEDEDMMKRSDALHQQCMGCHEDDGTAPTKCSLCHVL